MSKRLLLFVLIIGMLWIVPAAYADDDLDEEALFTSTIAPDALILLDMSGSMADPPSGPYLYIDPGSPVVHSCGDNVAYYLDSTAPHTKQCSRPSTFYGNTTCSGPFYTSSRTGYTTVCSTSKLTIARQAIFDILDDTNNGIIDDNDSLSLGVRLGYMRYQGCSNNDDNNYSTGCNKRLKEIGTKYQNIYCGNSTSCTSSSVGTSTVNSSETASGGTPLATALGEAKSYLDWHKSQDGAKACRDKFVILITDGSDTYACSGSGGDFQDDMYKRRREVVARAKQLADAGYRTFVVGFGSTMPHYLLNTLNWMAYYGATDDPNAVNSGDITAYNPSLFPATSCTTTTVSGLTACVSGTGNTYDAAKKLCYHNAFGDDAHYYAPPDPGELPLTGYAFLARNPADLSNALRYAISMIKEASYSFSQASVQSSRTQDENFIYEGSFSPASFDPFWRGYLKKYNISSDGTVGSMVWDAGSSLQAKPANTRNILTYKAGALVPFKTPTDGGNITFADVAMTTDAERDAVVGYIRGEAAYNPDNWKLGDVFRSTPITIGSPSFYFDDLKDTGSSPNAFAQFRTNHQRTSANGLRLITAGANDGQMHAFYTTSPGDEAWSFIPPNFLPKLKNIVHTTHPSSLTHQYFVDGGLTVADVWWPGVSPPCNDAIGSHKCATDWKTIMIFGEGRGGKSYLWSTSASCDTGFNAKYYTGGNPAIITNPYYCGYYALNVTDSLNPLFLWHLNPNSAQTPYVGEPWSRFMTGRVMINGNEKWVGIVGGGYNATNCAANPPGTCTDPAGKAIFVVDLIDGTILWSYSHGANDSTHSDMLDYSMPAEPAIADTDSDGFIDTVYLGDLGGNMWRFRFPTTRSDGSFANTTDWTGNLFFNNSTGTRRPIYNIAAVVKDMSNHIWVYWGTGDKSDPTATTYQERFYALQDNNPTATYTLSNLEDITSGTYTGSSGKNGWYINLTLGAGEKVLSDPTVFGGVVYFTTYTPPQGTDPCAQGGTATLYALNYTSGGGAIPAGGGAMTRTLSLGVNSGIASAPIISMKPGSSITPDLYVTTSGGSGFDAQTRRVNLNPPTLPNKTNMLYWKDRRLQ